jgi:hypothetical protein
LKIVHQIIWPLSVAPAYLKTYQQIFDQGFAGIKGTYILTTMDEFKKQLAGV